jgi:hypothetical protein
MVISAAPVSLTVGGGTAGDESRSLLEWFRGFQSLSSRCVHLPPGCELLSLKASRAHVPYAILAEC